MNQLPVQSDRLHEIDVLYAIGMPLAILGHSHPNDWSTFPGVGFYQPVCVYILYLFLAGTGGCGTSRQPFSRAVVHSDPGNVRRRCALPCDSDLGLPQMQFSAL